MYLEQQLGELSELLAACKGSTQTNCWWATYRAAQLIQPEIESEIQRRHGRAKKTIQTFAALTAKPGAGISIAVPAEAPDANATVIVLEIEGEPKVLADALAPK